MVDGGSKILLYYSYSGYLKQPIVDWKIKSRVRSYVAPKLLRRFATRAALSLGILGESLTRYISIGITTTIKGTVFFLILRETYIPGNKGTHSTGLTYSNVHWGIKRGQSVPFS